MTNANTHQDKWSNWSLKSMGFVSQLDQDFVLGHSVGSFIHLVQRCTTCIPKRSSHKRTSWMSQKLENSTHQSMDARKKVWLWFNIHFLFVFKMRTPQHTDILFNYHINSIINHGQIWVCLSTPSSAGFGKMANDNIEIAKASCQTNLSRVSRDALPILGVMFFV